MFVTRLSPDADPGLWSRWLPSPAPVTPWGSSSRGSRSSWGGLGDTQDTWPQLPSCLWGRGSLESCRCPFSWGWMMLSPLGSALLWILSVELFGWKPSGSLQPTRMSTGERKWIPGVCLDVEQPLACVGVQGDKTRKKSNKWMDRIVSDLNTVRYLIRCHREWGGTEKWVYGAVSWGCCGQPGLLGCLGSRGTRPARWLKSEGGIFLIPLFPAARCCVPDPAGSRSWHSAQWV